jgi:DUF4097 and DUF4098 domain-containing protein YvlB
MKVTNLVVISLLCICFISTGYARAEEFSFELEKVFEVGKERATLNLSNSSGKVTIESHSQDRAVIHATKVVKVKDEKEANEIAEKIKIDIKKDGQAIIVETEYPEIKPKGFWRDFWGFNWGHTAWVDYQISVPNKTKMDIHSTSGDVEIRDIQEEVNIWVTSGDIMLENIIGGMSIKSTSGDMELYNTQGKTILEGTSSDIKIRRARGNITLSTTSGDVYGEKLEGNLSVSQSSGDLELTGVNGDITANSSSGDKYIEQEQGNLNLSTSSGDIKATINVLPNKEYLIESTSGDVRLYIPSQSGAEIKLKTVSGNIDCKVPMELRIATAKRIEGKINEGGPQIEIETTSGDIFLFSK